MINKNHGSHTKGVPQNPERIKRSNIQINSMSRLILDSDMCDV